MMENKSDSKSSVLRDSASSDTSDSSENECAPPQVITKVRKSSPITLSTSNTSQRRKTVSVCLSNCRYDVVRRVSSKFDFKEVGEGDTWNLYWTDLSISIERCKEMKRYQRINHFPGMLEICRKDLLARNLNRMQRLFPNDYIFFPKTWCFPADLGEAQAYGRLKKNKTFILKPDAGSQGKGIFITRSLKDMKPSERMVCQVYVARPFLIEGYKFDLRVYTLITSCDPLRVYVYREGLVRFATSRYKEPTGINVTNVFMHLTNYAVNKHSRTYNIDAEYGSKRKLTWLSGYLKSMGYDTDCLWRQIDDVIVKTILCAWPVLKHSYIACFPHHDTVPACCELLGVDIILDKHLVPYVLEVNHSPSFHTDTDIDCEVKENMLEDMFKMLNLQQCDKRKIIREDKKRIRERLIHGGGRENLTIEPRIFTEFYRHEMNNRGSFRLVYPCHHSESKFTKFFNQGQGSLYCDTVCSRARETAQTAMREELAMKAKLEDSKRITVIKPQVSKTKLDVPCRLLQKPSVPTHPPFVLCSFEPQMIVESEEKERLMKLLQRDFFVRSFGLLEHVFFSFKKNGVLRPQDERKLAAISRLCSMGDAPAVDVEQNESTNITDLLEGIRSGEMNLIRRPKLPPSVGSLTRTQVARALSNTNRLAAAQKRVVQNVP